MAKTKPKTRSKAKQGYLDVGEQFLPTSIPDIDLAADAYVEARDARMSALTEELERKEVLKGLMKSHNLTAYEYDEKVVTLAGEPDVRVKRKKSEESNGDE